MWAAICRHVRYSGFPHSAAHAQPIQDSPSKRSTVVRSHNAGCKQVPVNGLTDWSRLSEICQICWILQLCTLISLQNAAELQNNGYLSVRLMLMHTNFNEHTHEYTWMFIVISNPPRHTHTLTPGHDPVCRCHARPRQVSTSKTRSNDWSHETSLLC